VQIEVLAQILTRKLTLASVAEQKERERESKTSFSEHFFVNL